MAHPVFMFAAATSFYNQIQGFLFYKSINGMDLWIWLVSRYKNVLQGRCLLVVCIGEDID